MRFLDVVRLTEMNVANMDTIKADFAHMLDKMLNDQQITLTKPLYDLIVKRAVKAMQNDDAGHMVTRQPVTLAGLADDAPAWLRASVTRGEDVFDIAFKTGFENRLAHVLDWLRADPDAAKIVKATPEADFLGLLAKAADAYFAKASNAADKTAHQAAGEPGREVIMTFRRNPTTSQIVMIQEADLAANAQGPVVMFWAKLTSAEALNREGKLMKHCVGSYADVVASEQVVIYSLRDPQNEPHATVELSQRGGSPSINQVKGKANQPPLGRYGVYVKDFLNALGVPASSGGASDVQGMGLLAHNGKFGTILDVGGIILEAFANGDTLRTLHQQNARPGWGRVAVTQHQVMYVEKDGTVPFTFSVALKDDAEPTPENVAECNITSFNMVRKEVSRFPVYAKHMIDFLNRKRLKGATKTFEAIGVFYDGRNDVYGLWGTRADLTKHLFNYKGVAVSRIAEDVFFADAKGTVFATGQLVRNAFGSIKIINQCDAVALLPELVREIGNQVLKRQMLNKDYRDYFAGYGVFWNNSKETYTDVPDDRVVYKSKRGRVSLYMHRLFFYGPTNTLIASYAVGKDTRPYEINGHRLHSFGTQGTKALYTLLSDITKEDTSLLAMGDFSLRELRELGFYLDGKRMRPLSEVETDIKLGGGYSVSIRVTDYGSKVLTLLKAGQEVASARVNTENEAQSISYSPDAVTRRMQTKAQTQDVRIAVAAMLNAGKVRMRMIDLFRAQLQVKSDKYAALDNQKDAILLDFLQGTVDLGGGLVFKRLIYLDQFGRDRDDYRDKRLGYIQSEHQTVVNIEFSDTDFEDLTYRMYKRLPEDVTRELVVKTLGKFMHFYHAKIEPYMSTGLFWPTGRAKIAALNDEANDD